MDIVNPLFKNILILIKGGGDLASGVAFRLHRAGFPVAMTELPTPTMVRRAVSFGSAVYEDTITVEGVKAVKSTPVEIEAQLEQGLMPILVAPIEQVLTVYKPVVLIDAVIAKRNTGTTITDSPLVIALGPGFYAGRDCRLVIETNRGHWLGRIISSGPAQADTGKPGTVKGQTKSRILRAPVKGHLVPHAAIGDRLSAGDIIAAIGEAKITAPFDGVLRGLVHPNVTLTPGFKIGDIDPRGEVEHCFTISDKSLAIGGGALQAILAGEVVRKKMVIQNGH